MSTTQDNEKNEKGEESATKPQPHPSHAHGHKPDDIPGFPISQEPVDPPPTTVK